MVNADEQDYRRNTESQVVAARDPASRERPNAGREIVSSESIGAGISSLHGQAAADLMNELVRVFKVRRLYDPGHPQRVETESAATARVDELLNTVGPIELEVKEDTFQWLDEIVYRRPTGTDSLAFLMYREGLRKLSFHPGLVEDELAIFLDNVAASATTGFESELIARLWEERLLHIRYTYVERLADREWVPAKPELVPEVDSDEDVPTLDLDDEDRIDVTRLPLIHESEPNLYRLDDQDMAYLERQLHAEQERGVLEQVLTCMRELVLNPPHEDPSPILGALEEIQNGLLERNEFEAVQTMHELFQPCVDEDQANVRAQETFGQMRTQSLATKVLEQLTVRLEAGQVTDADVAGFYRVFGTGNMATLLAGLPDFKRLCQRPILAETFVELNESDPEALIASMEGTDHSAARSAAYLAGLISDQRLLEPLGRMLTRPEAKLRREALLALKQFEDPRALALIAERVDDSDPAIRLYALRHVIGHRYTLALEGVASLINSRELSDRSPAERRLFFEAYGTLGGSTVVDSLARRLRRRGGFFRRVDPEGAFNAAIGLLATETVTGREILERASESGSPHVRQAARRALDGDTGKVGYRT